MLLHRRILARSQRRVETLEPRAMLAGDITATVVDGLLLLDGDAAGNQLIVRSGDHPGDFLVGAIADSGTTINGQAQPQPFADVRSILAALGAGDDAIVIDDARIAANVFIRTGPGNDLVVLGRPDGPMATTEVPSVAIGGAVAIMTGAGNDTVVAADLAVADLTSVNMGQGDDSLRLGRPMMTDATDLRPSVTLGGALEVHLGNGQNTMALSHLHVRGSLLAEGGAGIDRITLNHVAVRHALQIWSGAGEDQLAVQRSTAVAAMMDTGIGDDHAAIVDSAFRSLSLQLGAGDDTMSIRGTEVTRAALFHGGRGNDRLINRGGNEFTAVRILGFEHPDPEAVG